ncbi:MAG: GNAT family N-acetyltransferase [Bacillota bacterium]
MILYHERGAIRKATSNDDANTLAKWWADGNVMAHAGFPLGIKTDVEKLKQRLSNQSKNDILWIIEDDDHLPIGEMHYTIEAEKATLGIKICDATKHNKGLGTTILKRMIAHLFSAYPVNYIWLDTMIENTRAQHVYESLHFEKINILKDAWKDQLGNLRTAIEYKLTRETYKKNEAFYTQTIPK